MPARVKKEGRYALRKTTRGHNVLELEGGDFFAWVEGQRGEILVRSDADHEFEKTLSEGRFRYVEFEDDPDYKDMPHLFLQEGQRYREVMLPSGLPTASDHQKKLVDTGNKPAAGKVDGYLDDAEGGEG